MVPVSALGERDSAESRPRPTAGASSPSTADNFAANHVDWRRRARRPQLWRPLGSLHGTIERAAALAASCVRELMGVSSRSAAAAAIPPALSPGCGRKLQPTGELLAKRRPLARQPHEPTESMAGRLSSLAAAALKTKGCSRLSSIQSGGVCV
jgi:hypothetical protein